jgi:hypothetical protein
MDQHELPLTLTMTDTSAYLVRDLLGAAAPAGRRIAVRAEGVEVGPFGDQLPRGMDLFPADPVTSKIRLDQQLASRRRVQFTVAARTPKVQAALAKAGIEGAHMLAELCLSTLRHYYQEYRAKLASEIEAKGPEGR